jgi:hypothetical protein
MSAMTNRYEESYRQSARRQLPRSLRTAVNTYLRHARCDKGRTPDVTVEDQNGQETIVFPDGSELRLKAHFGYILRDTDGEFETLSKDDVLDKLFSC